jgi:hypothetical protein
MAKNQGQAGIGDLARHTLALFQFNRMEAPQLESLLQAQDGIAKELASFSRNGFQHV